MKKVLHILIICICLFINKVFAQDSRVYQEYSNIVQQKSQNAKLNTQVLLEEYQSNKIPEDVRVELYKAIFQASDLKNWNPELKSIVLLKLVETDFLENNTPAYLLMESGYRPFIKRVQEIVKSEFAFLEEIKAEYRKKLNIEEGSDLKIELDQDMINEAIHKVYDALFIDKENSDIYKF